MSAHYYGIYKLINKILCIASHLIIFSNEFNKCNQIEHEC